ncbi:MAG: hypothetical protein BWY06_00522 [Candidatus Latescibacteria bacterium ADurb.Bin168]|nr:MAG: hypothetical protein BWY06_00522 [Candidatus Latescibacteria bacterium ADurb.Bin168]
MPFHGADDMYRVARNERICETGKIGARRKRARFGSNNGDTPLRVVGDVEVPVVAHCHRADALYLPRAHAEPAHHHGGHTGDAHTVLRVHRRHGYCRAVSFPTPGQEEHPGKRNGREAQRNAVSGAGKENAKGTRHVPLLNRPEKQATREVLWEILYNIKLSKTGGYGQGIP